MSHHDQGAVPMAPGATSSAAEDYGHHMSVRHECLLIGTRGSCLPDNRTLFDSVQTIERTAKHSEKPERFRQIIETLYTHGGKIELFARSKREGWTAWGNELGASAHTAKQFDTVIPQECG